MPMLIEHIDAIARKKGRAVLFLEFNVGDESDPSDSFLMDWDDLPIRKQVIAWLDHNEIKWCPCAPFASENMMCGSLGWIYIDVPFDIDNPVYKMLADYLETPEGEMKIEGVRFCYLPLELAMKNAHHDEPGFWEKWAKDF